MSSIDVQPAAAVAAGGGGIGKFPQRKLSGDLKLRLARLPSLGGEGGGGDPGKSYRGGACSSRRARTDGLGVRLGTPRCLKTFRLKSPISAGIWRPKVLNRRHANNIQETMFSPILWLGVSWPLVPYSARGL